MRVLVAVRMRATLRSAASHMLQVCFGRVVTTSACRHTAKCRNVDLVAVSDAQFFYQYLASCALHSKSCSGTCATTDDGVLVLGKSESKHSEFRNNIWSSPAKNRVGLGGRDRKIQRTSASLFSKESMTNLRSPGSAIALILLQEDERKEPLCRHR
jgi:hypothetical protein